MLPYSEFREEFRLLSDSLYCFLPCNSSLVLSLTSEVTCMCDVEHCIVFKCCGESVTLARHLL